MAMQLLMVALLVNINMALPLILILLHHKKADGQMVLNARLLLMPFAKEALAIPIINTRAKIMYMSIGDLSEGLHGRINSFFRFR